jgi:hypothetical protein
LLWVAYGVSSASFSSPVALVVVAAGFGEALDADDMLVLRRAEDGYALSIPRCNTNLRDGHPDQLPLRR